MRYVMSAGVFKNWPDSHDSLVDVTRVEELRVLKQTEVRQPANLPVVYYMYRLNKLLMIRSARSRGIFWVHAVCYDF